MLIEIDNIERNIVIIKTIMMFLFTYYTNFKIMNKKVMFKFKDNIGIILIGWISGVIRYEISYIISIISLIIMVSIIFSKEKIINSILSTVISLSTNYILQLIAIIMCFAINRWVIIKNDYMNLIIIVILHLFILINVLKIKKFKYGISFLQKEFSNEYMDLLILNISVIVLFSVIIIVNSNAEIIYPLSFGVILFSVIMFITIQKSLQLYYKQKILVKELEETKDELAKKNKEIEDLEAENISISKKSHTLSHKQKSLEYKIEQMLAKAEISTEDAAEVKERLKTIKEEFNKEKATIELDKTEISEIDDMLKYMQLECIKNKIDFELQIKGNIHHMTNNLITKEDLETLLADHIKNAIIAINHTDNINRSILVRLGKIDEAYGFYIYDSGIEFQKETLENLGKIPSTTHADEGGTGMGFMNTFDTLRKCKASLIIEEYNEPSKDNYTKAIIIKFDGKNEFKINSYREKYQKI